MQDPFGIRLESLRAAVDVLLDVLFERGQIHGLNDVPLVVREVVLIDGVQEGFRLNVK